jgi:asparagine synthase (glutamine-hydrolysing)
MVNSEFDIHHSPFTIHHSQFIIPMCGIAGVVTRTGPSPDGSMELALQAALAHRGPDGTGAFRSEHAMLVHRRLAIIDRSVAASQPMAYADGRFQLVFNGEVYNHLTLRGDMEARGERFVTSSDTEVLLRLLTLEGPAGLHRVRGMFALALWDDMRGTLTLARDRFGMKPLYIAATDRQLAFASEIGALRRAGLVSRQVSAAGVLAYLSWASIPAPLTWLDGVEMLEPGTWRSWSRDGRDETGRFADMTRIYVGDDVDASADELRQMTADAVRDSVRAHLVADVPVGVFLSGGVDSGAIVSAARSLGDRDLLTYTVVVDEAEYSEAPIAARVAAQFRTTHHELHVDARAIATDLPDIVQHLDQPTADAINTYYVARAVAQTGIKAVLSGVGGDEMFGGYPSFDRVPAGLQMARALGPVMRATGVAATLAMPAWRAAKWRHFAQDPDIEQAYRALRGFLMPEELDAIAGPALADRREQAEAALAAAEERLFAPAGYESTAASVSRLETRGFLGTQLLRDIDAMSMAHGLEVRAPFVDHPLQQTVWPFLGHCPSLMKGKRLLYETLERPLPAEVTSRPKQGFTLPFEKWMRRELREATRDGLRSLATQGWIVPAAVDRVWNSWLAGQSHWSRPWGLGMLGRFLEDAP